MCSKLPAEIVAGEQPLPALLANLFKKGTDIYHVQFEYRGFGNFARSLVLLVLLSLLLHIKRPVVITLHGVLTPESLERRHLKWPLYFAFLTGLKLAGLFATEIVVHSELMRDVLRKSYRLTNVTIIHHGADTQGLTLERNPSSNSLLFFGFVRPSKGIEHLIDAVELIRGICSDVSLTVAGSSARPEEALYLKDLQRKVEESGLKESVRFFPRFLSMKETSKLVSEAVAVVLPYTDHFVEVSGVIYDLAGYGIPVVCSNVPRFSELNNEIECLKVTPDPDHLAEAILRLIRDPELRSRLGSNLRLKAQSQSWDNVAAEHLSMYRRLTRRVQANNHPSRSSSRSLSALGFSRASTLRTFGLENPPAHTKFNLVFRIFDVDGRLS